jgi:hypothetical protein
MLCKKTSRIAGNFIGKPSGDIGRKYGGLPGRPGGPLLVPKMYYLEQQGYTGLYLGVLKSGWVPWWILRDCVRRPRRIPWNFYWLLTSPDPLVLKE